MRDLGAWVQTPRSQPDCSVYSHPRAQEVVTRQALHQLKDLGFVVLDNALEPELARRAVTGARALQAAGYTRGGGWDEYQDRDPTCRMTLKG